MKKVTVCHNVIPHEKNMLSERAVQYGLAGMDGFIVHGRSEEQDIKRLFPGKPVLKLYHPVYDIFLGNDMPKSAARKALGIAPDKRIVLYFGLILSLIHI